MRDRSLGTRKHATPDQGRIDAQQEAALAAGADRHVAVDEEHEPAEHAPLGQAPLILHIIRIRSASCTS
jgi:hypothetical protein